MRCMSKTVGVGVLMFGAGILLCLVLPASIMVCVQAGVIVVAGLLLFAK